MMKMTVYLQTVAEPEHSVVGSWFIDVMFVVNRLVRAQHGMK